jgi:hypothetical protein
VVDGGIDDEWRREMFDAGKYKSGEYTEYLKKRLEEIRKKR